jgi:membrane associated rhomboid family serine protease
LSYQQFKPSGFSIIPTVVKNILIINGIMFLAMLLLDKKYNMDLMDVLGMHYPTSPNFRWYQVLTHMFMHFDFWHIALNMYGVWMFGSAVENYWGPKRFIIFYLVAGLGSAFLHTLYTTYQIHQVDLLIANPTPDGYLSMMSKNYKLSSLIDFYNAWKAAPDSGQCISIASQNLMHLRSGIADSPMAGASGALFGILLAFGMYFPNTELMILIFPIPIKAKYFVMIYGAFELFSGVSQRQGDNIAHFAHLGGMLFGFILIKIWQKDRKHFY